MPESSSRSLTPSFPLNRAQHRLWKIEQIAGQKSKPNEVLCVEIEGNFLRDSLFDVVRTIVGKNQQYHSKLLVQDGAVSWCPGEPGDVSINEIAITLARDGQLGENRLAICIDDIYQFERAYEFRLELECPLRINIVFDSAACLTYLLLSFHPVVMTRKQLDIIFHLIKAGWAGVDEKERLPSTTKIYAKGNGEGGINHHASLLSRELQNFPTDRKRDLVKNFVSHRYAFSISKEQYAALGDILEDASQQKHLAVFALFAIAAARYAQQKKICIGMLDCSACDDDTLATPNISTLFDHTPVLVELISTLTFAGFVSSLVKKWQLASVNVPVVLESLLDEISVAHAMSFSPFCQIAFEYGEQTEQAMQRFQSGVAGIRRHYPQEAATSFSHSEIEFMATLSSDGQLDCVIEYSAALFEAATIERFAGHFNHLLQSVLDHPDASLADVDLMTPSERQKLLRLDANQTFYPSLTLDALFDAQALRTPEATAIIEQDTRISFAQLSRMAARLATQLVSEGIVAGDRVGVYMPRSADFVVSVLAILRCGAAYVPLDAQFPLERVQHIELDGKLKCVLHRDNENALPHWKHIRSLCPDDEAAAAGASFSSPFRDHQATDAAYVIYTSGSTGKPRGVIGNHKSVVNRVFWAKEALALDEHDIFCMKTRIAFVDHVAEMFQALLTGQPLVIISDAELLNVSAFIGLLDRHQVSRLTVVPFMLTALLEEKKFSGLSRLKSIICSGDVLSFGLARRLFRVLPKTRLFNIYGLTETGADSSCYEIPYEPGVELADFFMKSQQVSLPALAQGSHDNLPPASEDQPITIPHISVNELKKNFLDSQVPVNALSVDEYLAWLNTDVLPYSVNVSSKKFIGHMTSALPDFMSEMSALVARLNQNMVKVETSKALTFLERQLLAMLHRAFFDDAHASYEDRIQNPDHVFGLVVSGGSSANITAMWNARNRALLNLGYSKADIIQYGAFELLKRSGYEGFAIIASGLAHYSIRKATSLLGIGERNLLVLKQDARQKADVADLELKLAQCQEKRLLVIAIIGIAGATETGTIDPITDMAAIARHHRIHFHVDAAWGGAMVFSKKYKALLKGIEDADSITLCPHKQLYVPQGISVCLFRDSQSIHASSVQAVYQGRQGSFDIGQYTIEGSRPAIFLSLHAMFHIVSRRGIAALVEQGIEKTRYLADVLNRHEAFELVGTPEINILNYRYIPRSLRHKKRFSVEENREISKAIVSIQEKQFLQGKTFVSKTDILNENYCPERMTVFRVVIANPLTTLEDIEDNLVNQLEIADRFIEDSLQLHARDQAGVFHQSLRQQLDIMDRYHVPIGQSIANTEILVLDEALRLLPVGIVGEIYIGGDGLANGYVNEADTATAFVPHPFKPGARLFKTSDFGRRLPSGDIEYVGRRDQQVKVRGMRIELGEIEAHICQLGMVSQCLVLAEPRDADSSLQAFVVLHDTASASAFSEKTIRRQLIASLPLYMVPETLHIVDALPLTASGKIDRQKLKSQYEGQIRQPSSQIPSLTETKLLEMCEHILDRKQLRTTDNFFEIGGHSLAAASLQRQIKDEFAVELSFHSLFVQPRLEDIACMIDEIQCELI
ncbi:aminotransferase class V-fold PLP-dependent enzyme [Undibacterium sp. TJN19]|uniref:aminotransferase class V-fold PLP-dependent enzyme n=1 Tax=Undibacterium sp. TJN19 TaxID=3413055 RepID=UPI003BF199CD